jgi:pimeloyl-ACP methyl ester carboxylesterase
MPSHPSRKSRAVLEPQSTALFLLLMAVFGGLVGWAVVAKQAVFRLLAACLAFVPAMLFGVAAVNKYYGYYETWGAVVADFTNGGVQNIPRVPAAGPGSSQAFDLLLGRAVNVQQAAQSGAVIGLKVNGSGPATRIVRDVVIYLPPQYFQKQYASYRFPVIELIHGQPGQPEDWLAALDVQTTLQRLVAAHRADPVVLVMPDVNGARTISLQCLNQVGGAADETYVATDVPNFVAARVRVERPGRAWGIAGYSEGGYCTANLALRHPGRYGLAGVMSGYFQPLDNRVEYKHVFERVDPFHGNVTLREQNTPADILRKLPAGSHIPQFWIGASRPRQDIKNAVMFVGLLRKQNPATPLLITPDGAHNAVAWRSMITPMLEWMTPRLAQAAVAQGCNGCVTPFGTASGNMIPGSRGSLTQPGSAASRGQIPAHAQRTAGAALPAAPGAGRLPDRVRLATG